jgi:hypothetical protein
MSPKEDETMQAIQFRSTNDEAQSEFKHIYSDCTIGEEYAEFSLTHLSVHDVKSITRKTRTIPNEGHPFKVTDLVLCLTNGKRITISAYLED